MYTQEIDEIIDALNNERYNRVFEILGIKKHKYIEDFVEENYFDFINIIIDGIKQKNLEYFLAKIGNIKNSRDITNMLKAIDNPNYLKSIISDKNRINELKLDTYDIVELINATGEVGYIKSIIEDEKFKEQFKFFSSDYYRLIEATKDKDYIEKIIDDNEKLIEYKLTGYYLIELVKATNDSKFIQKIINDERKRRFCNCSDYDMYKLIIATNDANYIKEVFINETLKKYGFYSWTGKRFISERIKDAICSAKDDTQFIESIITNPDLLNEYSLKSNEIVDILIRCFDRNYIINIINDKEKIEEYSLDIDGVIKIIMNLYSPEQIQNLINNADISNKYGIPNEQFIKLVLATKSKQIITKYLVSIENKNNLQILDIPENMTIGMEIESEGANSQFIKDIKMLLGDDWLCKEDRSLREGVEVISPILTSKTENISNEINNVFNILNILRTRGI
ncbi:MAG: hypothetical protein IJH76_04115 [Clostridia bacterium]|nr:hypothetical protein [Clostridia bacterium]